MGPMGTYGYLWEHWEFLRRSTEFFRRSCATSFSFTESSGAYLARLIGTHSAIRIRMASSRIGFVVSAVGAMWISACDSSATTPSVVENVTYVTNVYTNGSVDGSSPAVVIAPRPTRAGIPACDAFFSATYACARSLTSDEVALSHFAASVEAARAQAANAEMSGNRDTIARAASACEAAADAYRLAPCR